MGRAMLEIKGIPALTGVPFFVQNATWGSFGGIYYESASACLHRFKIMFDE
jgi:hypothetical protein